jgi:hypothetical protein
MTHKQKSALVAEVMNKVGYILEYWSETVEQNPELSGVDYDDAREALASWMSRLPGDYWNRRLDPPSKE